VTAKIPWAGQWKGTFVMEALRETMAAHTELDSRTSLPRATGKCQCHFVCKGLYERGGSLKIETPMM